MRSGLRRSPQPACPWGWGPGVTESSGQQTRRVCGYPQTPPAGLGKGARARPPYFLQEGSGPGQPWQRGWGWASAGGAGGRQRADREGPSAWGFSPGLIVLP